MRLMGPGQAAQVECASKRRGGNPQETRIKKIIAYPGIRDRNDRHTRQSRKSSDAENSGIGISG